MKNGWTRDTICHSFRERNFSVTLLSGLRVLLFVLDNRQAEVHIPYPMSVPTVFKAQLYFHTMALKSKEVGRKKLKIVQCAINSRLIGIVVQLQKTLDALTKFQLPHLLRIVI